MRVASPDHEKLLWKPSKRTLLLGCLAAVLIYRWLVVGAVVFESSPSTAQLTTNKLLEDATTIASSSSSNNIQTTRTMISPKYNDETAAAAAAETRNNSTTTDTTTTATVVLNNRATTPSSSTKPSKSQIIMPTRQPLLVFGDAVGYYIMDESSSSSSSGRLVVHVNETHLFWKKAQLRLCRILRQMTHSKELGGETTTTTTTHPPPQLMTLQLSVNCQELASSEAFGQGNWITALYMVRMATALAKVDLQFTCREDDDDDDDDANNRRDNQLLPLFQGYYDHSNIDKRVFFTGSPPTTQEACTSKYDRIRLDKLAHQIQKDMRQMAETVKSETDKKKKNNNNNNNNNTMTIDDVAIHFRCGDVLGGQFRNDFGMIPFREYRRWIWNNTTTSIGIITQPFQRDRNRKIDGNRAEACRVVVHKLADYLQSHYPHASIRIHNDPDLPETLPMAYARMVLARQTFTSLSSFGIFPVVGTYGHGYFQKGNSGVNPWATHVPQYLSNVHEMRAPVLGTHEIYKMITTEGLDPVLEWFVAEE
jgi:hypothetical protein